MTSTAQPTLWITGAAGFSGRHLLGFLARTSEKPHVVALDIRPAICPGADEFRAIDTGDVDAVAAAAAADRPTWLIHLAGAMPPAPTHEMWQRNVVGTLTLLHGLDRADSRHTRVVTIGSAAEYHPKPSGAMEEHDPCGGSSVYGYTKWAQTSLALSVGAELGIPVIVARPFNLIGPGLPTRLVAGWLCEQFASVHPAEFIEIGNIDSARDFIDVRDAVAAYWGIVRHGRPGEVYNVCTGRAVSVRELLAVLREITGRFPEIRVDPARIRGIDPATVYGSPAKLEADVRWQACIPLRQSLADMLQTGSTSTA